ncbi:MAG: hypothetical protein Kow002_00800 [Anaerolineales bacterium]
MNNKKLGCLTPLGIAAMLITIAAIAGTVYARGGLLYNPGPLNAQEGEALGGVRSHAEIGGECEACHTAPWEVESMADRCVNCHGEIATQMQNMLTLHGTMYQNNPRLECRHCHPDHKGANAPLTVMQGGEFPHELLGYSLNGHRQTVQGDAFLCADCHADDIASFDQDACETCHRQMDAVFTQAHILSYSSDCLACHDGIDTLGKKFDHNRYEFKLSGQHADVICAECHVNARRMDDFRTTPQDCDACHAEDDAHQGRYGQVCEQCHTVEGWQPAKFDHDLSVFKLEGAHREVRCESCHIDGIYQGTPADCYNCHQEDDEHRGEFGADCAACHTPLDWEEATFDHNLSNFPLDGAHVTVTCKACHVTAQFSRLSTACVACHEDPVFHAGALGTDCVGCHSTSAWTPARFNVSHPQPRVDEEGTGANHGYTTCRTCHPSTVQSFTCTACHDSNNPDDDDDDRRGGGDDDDDDDDDD